ncbi:N-acetylgalactosamine-6-sulfatase [soil metagenome]
MYRVAACFAVLIVSGATALADDRPNIIVLFADDLGYGELGCQGNPQIPTPHIDSIAEAGVRFTNGYVSAPNCSPSRAGLLTGRIQTRFGYEFNPVGARNEDPEIGLPRSERTLAEGLRELGYTTGLIGKWHLGGTAEYHPRRRGFDEFFGFLHEGHFFIPPPWPGVTTMLRRRTLPDGGKGRWEGESGSLVYSTHMGHDEPPYDANNPILRDGQPVVEEAYLTDAFTREAVDFIDRHQDKPFFLYLSYNAVHSPLQATDAYMDLFSSIEDVQRRIFAGMLANLDDSVGEVLDKLREVGLEERTLVFFLSDNGGPTRELTSSNHPLRGEKSQVYEGGLRVPFLVQWKGQLPAGEIYNEPVISLDIFATALAAAGSPLPDGIDGVDLLPYLKREKTGAPHDTFYWRQGPRTAVRSGSWKLLTMDGGKRWELYDLAEDIGEAQDRADDEPDRLEELKRLWKRLDSEMDEPRF